MINFTLEELQHVILPHNYPLVATLHIGVYQVQRILVDADSLTNILFYECFQWMGQEHQKLEPSLTILVGFNDKITHAAGQLTLEAMDKTM